MSGSKKSVEVGQMILQVILKTATSCEHMTLNPSHLIVQSVWLMLPEAVTKVLPSSWAHRM